MLAQGDQGRRLGRLRGGFAHFEQLLRTLVAEESRACVRIEFQDCAADARPGLLECRGGDAFAKRDQEDLHEVLDDVYLPWICGPARPTKFGFEYRIPEQPGGE